MPNKEICANCSIWKPESLAVSPIGTPSINKPENTSNQYGKCNVSFQGNNGELKVWDLGTLGSDKCAAIDDNNNPLFTPKVQRKTPTTG